MIMWINGRNLENPSHQCEKSRGGETIRLMVIEKFSFYFFIEFLRVGKERLNE